MPVDGGSRTLSNRVLYLTTVLIWGSTWLAIEFQLGVVAPEVSIVYRYALASFLLPVLFHCQWGFQCSPYHCRWVDHGTC